MKTVGWYWLGAFLAALVIFNGFYFLSDPEIPWWIQLTNFLIDCGSNINLHRDRRLSKVTGGLFAMESDEERNC
jgi:hypothetical protein